MTATQLPGVLLTYSITGGEEADLFTIGEAARLRRPAGPHAGQADFDYWLGEIEDGRSELEVIGQFLDAEEYHDRFLPVSQDAGIDLIGQAGHADSESSPSL